MLVSSLTFTLWISFSPFPIIFYHLCLHLFPSSLSSLQLPKGSAVQRMAMQCWCLHFQSQDHSFLLQSNMFSNISKALSGTEEGETGGAGSSNSDKRTRGDKVSPYTCMNIISLDPRPSPIVYKHMWFTANAQYMIYHLSYSTYIQSIDVVLMENIISKGKLKVSSNEAMLNRYNTYVVHYRE